MEEEYDEHKEYKMDAEKGWCRKYRTTEIRKVASEELNNLHWNAGVVKSPHFRNPVGLPYANFLLGDMLASRCGSMAGIQTFRRQLRGKALCD
jgi:hypothetical protein